MLLNKSEKSTYEKFFYKDQRAFFGSWHKTQHQIINDNGNLLFEKESCAALRECLKENTADQVTLSRNVSFFMQGLIARVYVYLGSIQGLVDKIVGRTERKKTSSSVVKVTTHKMLSIFFHDCEHVVGLMTVGEVKSKTYSRHKISVKQNYPHMGK
jgi:hypothetical protein